MFKKVLIANRGEIAVRVIRACKEWGIGTVAVHSDVDADSMHVRLADESVCIGSHQPQNSYLNISSIMSAVDLTGAEAIHPGYGFLSENAKFSEIVNKHGIKFIGPSAELISKMGDKIEAKRIAKKYGLPVIEGSEGGVKSVSEAKTLCKEIGYPVLIKAAGGGGGKGMKIVNEEKELENLFLTAKSEAKKFLHDRPVEILWGVGKTLKRKLNDDGIKTIGQIKEIDIQEIINRYGSIGSHIYSLSQGKDLRRVIPQRPIKSISHEITFENDISNKAILKKKLWLLCEKVSKRSKEKGLGGQTITLKLKTKEFKLISRSCTIEEPTQIGELIFQHSKVLLDRENDKIKYRLIGVGISNLKDSELCDLYDLVNISKTKNAKIEYAIDDIRNKFGQDLIKKGRSIEEILNDRKN